MPIWKKNTPHKFSPKKFKQKINFHHHTFQGNRHFERQENLDPNPTAQIQSLGQQLHLLVPGSRITKILQRLKNMTRDVRKIIFFK